MKTKKYLSAVEFSNFHIFFLIFENEMVKFSNYKRTAEMTQSIMWKNSQWRNELRYLRIFLFHQRLRINSTDNFIHYLSLSDGGSIRVTYSELPHAISTYRFDSSCISWFFCWYTCQEKMPWKIYSHAVYLTKKYSVWFPAAAYYSPRFSRHSDI